MPRFISLGCLVFLVTWPVDLSRLAAQEAAPVPAPDAKATLKQPNLIELGKLYRALELPLPPKEAFFAIIAHGYPSPPETHASPNLYYELRFATGGPYPKAKYRTWFGHKVMLRHQLQVVFTSAPEPEAVLRFIKMNQLDGGTNHEFGTRLELVFAIQCELLGHFDLAQFFYRRCQKLATEPFNHTLILDAWNYWARELTHPRRDRADVAKKLHQIVDKHDYFAILETVEGGRSGRTKELIDKARILLDQLDLILKSGHAKAGSIEAMIDDLLEDPSDYDDGEFWPEDKDLSVERAPISGENPDPIARKLNAESKLRNLGVSAIPFLIEHVDDQRPVRCTLKHLSYDQGDGDRTINISDFLTVGSRVRNILSTFFDLDRVKSTKDNYTMAWTNLQINTEEQFVARKLDAMISINDDFIRFSFYRYNKKLLEAYTNSLKQNAKMNPFHLVPSLIADSNFPKPTKIEMLTKLAHCGHLSQHYDTLTALFKVDNAAFSKICAESLPKWGSKYDRHSQDRLPLGLFDLAFRSEDQKVNEWVKSQGKNLPLNDKLRFLDRLASERIAGPNWLEILSYLCQFLDDATIYQPGKDEHLLRFLPGKFEEIAMRNFAALQILKCLSIDLSLSEETSESTWEVVRAFCKDEVNRRLENKKGQ